MNPVWFILSIILLPLTTVQAVIYMKPGDTVVLSPGSVGATIESITWKHNSNLAAEWYGGGAIDFYREFRGRCTLNTETGELIIPNLTLEDSGSYTPEINNRVLATTEVKIISGVSKPNVSENCDAEKTHCVLTCEGITTDSEPVTYTWWSDDKKKTETKEFKITKNDTEPSFTCKLQNPVSSERSREFTNPFTSSSSSSITGNRTLFIPILVLVLLILLVVVLVLYRLKHRKVEPQVPISTEYDTVQAINNDYGELPIDDNGRTVYATVEFANRDQGPDYAPMPPPNSNGTVYATVQRVTDQPALRVP